MAALAPLLALLLLPCCFGSATLKINLYRYNNTDGTVYNGVYCDGAAARCDHIFSFCVDHYLGNASPYSCLHAKHTSTYFTDTVSILFPPVIPPSINNPMVTSHKTWPGATLLKVDVHDYGSASAAPLLVDNMADYLIASPAASEGEAVWTNKVIIGNKPKLETTLEIRYTVYCDDNYYGAHCDVMCVGYDDDVNGHTSCNPATGEKQCLPGWQSLEANCLEQIDDCASDPCLLFSWCRDKHLGFECVCLKGINGTYCESNIDECVSDPCLNGGSCEDEIGGYRCLCPPRFAGDHCQIPKPKVNVEE